LIINVIENDPYAIYLQEGKSFLIDIDGTIITEINLDNYENELLFVKGENSPELLEQLIRDISIVFPNLIQNLDELEFIEKRRWNLKLNNKLLVKLPDENIQHSLKNLKQLFKDQEVMQSNIIEIDLRIQGRAAIKVLDGEIKYGIDEI
jgi:Cell division septal protein